MTYAINIQLSKSLLRAFWHVLVLDLSILGIHFKLAVDHLVFSAVYGFTWRFPISFVAF